MLVRSSLKRLTNTICYTMSNKKITEQWRKPIQQLKKQKQQATPIPADADQKKKTAMEFYEKQYLSKHKQRPEDALLPKEKKIFKKKGQQEQQEAGTAGTQQSKQQTKPKASEVNWLEMSQIKQTKELTSLVNEALNMSKLKYFPELKEILQQIKTKFGNEEIEYVLNTLFKQNFSQTFDNLKELGLEIVKMSPKIVNTVLFNFTNAEEYAKVQTLLKELKASKFHIEPRQEDFFELLFFRETSQDVPFEYGQNSVNISSDNSNFVKKLQIASTYLTIIEDAKKKRGGKRTNILPLWLNQSSKIVLRYRFGRKQFKRLLTQVLTHHEYLLPESFLESEQFSSLMKEFYFGKQQGLKIVLGCIERNMNKNVKFSVLYRNFTQKLMQYRAQNGKPAFEVDQELIEAYKRGFELHQKYLSIISSVIAADARYVDLAQHYLKSYMQGFPTETLSSDDTKFVEECIVSNYNSLNDSEKHEKLLTRLTKPGQNLISKLKAAIKLGNLTLAYKFFEEEVYKKVVIERQRKNIEFVLRSQLTSSGYFKIKEINEFLQTLNDQYLWSLYKRSEDVSVMLKKFIPEDKFSFWEEQQKKQLFEELSKKYSTGYLEKVKQPPSDIDATGFNLDEYLNTEFPQLRELEALEYEKQKDLIKLTLRLEGILFYRRVHSDDLAIEKLSDFLAQLSQQSVQVLENFGLKDYDIKEWGWQDFEKRFNNMKTQSNLMKDERLDWGSYVNYIERNKAINKKNIIEEMMIKTPEVFKEADALVKLNEEPIVNRLLLWGVYTKEPMAIYLGQKLAMKTGQVIPHEIAVKVSRMLSYKRPLSEDFIEKCKQCLKIVGKIDREFIYLFDKEYEHILQRKNFVEFVEDMIDDPKYDNREFEDLIAFTPRQQLNQNDVKLYRESIASRVL